jgi:hypothetical protein
MDASELAYQLTGLHRPAAVEVVIEANGIRTPLEGISRELGRVVLKAADPTIEQVLGALEGAATTMKEALEAKRDADLKQGI